MDSSFSICFIQSQSPTYFTGKMSNFTATFRKMSAGPYSVYSFLHTNICYITRRNPALDCVSLRGIPLIPVIFRYGWHSGWRRVGPQAAWRAMIFVFGDCWQLTLCKLDLHCSPCFIMSSLYYHSGGEIRIVGTLGTKIQGGQKTTSQTHGHNSVKS